MGAITTGNDQFGSVEACVMLVLVILCGLTTAAIARAHGALLQVAMSIRQINISAETRDS